MKTSVIVTSYNDPRIETTLLSLSKQTISPDEILVADGGTSWDIQSLCDKYGAKLEIIKGNVPETRSKVIFKAMGDIIVFIDTDESAPDDWLAAITNPIRKGEADFTGGPTKHSRAKTQAELYINLLEDHLYENLVNQDIRYLPMGNSAWKKEIFEKIGTFNTDISAAEDYDINMRAVNAGFAGKYVTNAWVYHDHSEINTFNKLIRKRYRYLRATAQVYLMQAMLKSRLSIKRRIFVRHPFYIVETALKPLAMLDALIRG